MSREAGRALKRLDLEDVPTGVDVLDPRRWTDETPRKRPWRPRFFEAFCAALSGSQLRMLELGSGPSASSL